MKRGVLFALLLLQSLPLWSQVSDGHLQLPAEPLVLPLRGTWHFLPHDIMASPETSTDSSHADWQLIPVPAQWHQRGLSIKGSGTYRLLLELDPDYYRTGLALRFSYISMAHEVYLNGKRIGGAGKIKADGQLSDGFTGSVLYVVPPEALQTGSNELKIRVASLYGLGGILMPDQYAGKPDETTQLHNQLVISGSVVCGIFFFASLMYFVSFLGRRSETYYFYFSLFAFALGLLVGGLKAFFQSMGISFLINSILLNVGLALLPLALLRFCLTFFAQPSQWSVRLSYLLTATFLLSVAFMSFYQPWFLYHARFVLPLNLVALCLSLLASIFLGFRGLREKQAGSAFLMAGLAIFILAGINDIAVYARLYSGLHIIEYGFLFLLVSMAGATSSHFSLVARNLDQKIQEGEEIRSILIRSEQRYRQLIEGSREIILTVDKDGIIYSANDAIRRYLSGKMDTILGQSFFDFIYEDKSGQSLGRYLARDFFEKASQSEEPVQFPCAFRTNLGEPRELLVRLERMSGSENELFLLKISEQSSNVLMPYRKTERQVYEIGNYLITPDLLSRRLVADLGNYLESSEIHGIRACLNEALLNAIEHGNLEIDFDTKTDVQNRNTYLDFIKERQKDPRFSERKVHVYYNLNPRHVIYRITDQGPGFDHEKTIAGARKPNQLLQHGRGILLMLNVFDEVRYNKKGNRVTLIKYFDRRPPDQSAG